MKLNYIKNKFEQLADEINKKRKKDGDWLYNNDYNKFRERNKYNFEEMEKLKKEYKRIKELDIPEISIKEKNILDKYNNEILQLEKKVNGNIYKVYIK